MESHSGEEVTLERLGQIPASSCIFYKFIQVGILQFMTLYENEFLKHNTVVHVLGFIGEYLSLKSGI